MTMTSYPMDLDPTHESAQIERHKIDAEVAALRQRIIALNQRRNGLAPVHKLPNEILCLIFLFYRSAVSRSASLDWPSQGSWHSAGTNIPSCLAWTKGCLDVCSRWRNVGMACPDLWTEIFIQRDSLQVMDLMLNRSQTCPVTVACVPSEVRRRTDADIAPPSWMISLNHTLKHTLERVQSLSLLGFPDSLLSDLAHNLPSTIAPQLRRLQLVTTLEHFIPPPRLPPKLSELVLTGCPSLTHLRLDTPLPVDLAGMTAPNLMSLELKVTLGRGPGSNQAMLQHDLLPVLASLPKLSYLHLERAYITDQFVGAAAESVTHIPALQNLKLLNAPGKQIAFFLRNIRASDMPSLTLQPTPDMEDPPEFYTSLRRFYDAHSESRPFRTLAMRRTPISFGRLSVVFQLRSSTASHVIHGPSLRNRDATSHFPSSLFRILPLAKVRTLEIDPKVRASMPVIDLHTLKKVTSLRISSMVTPSDIEQLSHSLLLRWNGTLLFPSLRHLEFTAYEARLSDDGAAQVLELLMKRQDAGLPLESFKSFVGDVKEDMMNVLNQVVKFERKQRAAGPLGHPLYHVNRMYVNMVV